MKKESILLVCAIAVISFIHKSAYSQNSKESNLIEYVNPFIGTKNMGHTYPGATAPFGMVQLSPETNQETMFIDGNYNTEVYKYCSGYQYSDSTIYGFGHTHFSGTGHSDLGDFMIMPTTGPLTLEPGNHKNNEPGFHSKFSHAKEQAQPGYYSVLLEDYNIKAELTASERVGFHKYSFAKDDTAHIILDLVSNIYNHESKNVWTFIRVENDTLITGYRQTTGWARTRKVFFAMTFSEPFISYGHEKYDKTEYNGFYRKFNEKNNFPEMAGKNIRAFFDFHVSSEDSLMIKFALSSVSTKGALDNMITEVPGWDFNGIKNQTQNKWNDELSKIIVETSSEDQLTTFYTALYHTMLSPIIYEDVSGEYLGIDQNIHTSEGFTNYTIFSLWDTYRALHPLFNLIQPDRNNDMVKSMLAHHDQSVHNMLPIWSHYSNENWCMVGYHSVSVIADAYTKGVMDFDINRALTAAINTSTVSYYDGLGSYMEYGYVPEDEDHYSVSKTLEYSYNDWCISQLAKAANAVSEYENYQERSENYKNVFDSISGYMRPRLANGSWRENFDPMDTHGQGFIEGNAWNYGLYVPHQIDSMVNMMGGKNEFSMLLDSIFTTEISDEYINKNEDITRDGIIGNYVHGNEPGHHIPYLYNYTNQTWKTQERVRLILDTMYGSSEDGLCGNDDAGQMSAWYIFSALGFYPVNPGSDIYEIGSPNIKSAVINLKDDKKLSIKVKNQNPNNIYVHKVILNGRKINGHQLLHSEIAQGGEIVFHMSSKPNK